MTDRERQAWGYSPDLKELQRITDKYPPLDHVGAPAGKDYKAGKETAAAVEETLKSTEE